MIKKMLFFIVSSIFLLSYSWAGEINSVVYEAGSLKIQLTDKTTYKVIPPKDLFKIIIELENIKPGILNKKILFHEGIVSEVQAKSNDRGGSLLEILLVEPKKPHIELSNNVLLVSFPHDSGVSEVFRQNTPKIIDLVVKKTEEGFEINIEGDSMLYEPTIVRSDKYTEVVFQNVKFDATVPPTIPVELKTAGENLVLVLPFGRDFKVKSLYLGDEVILEVTKIKAEEIKMASFLPEPFKKPEVKNYVPAENRKISFDLQDADIVGVLRLLGDVSGYNIVILPEVKGKITLKLSNVTWDQVLDIICKTFFLGKEIEGNIIRVAPLRVFQEEKRLLAEIAELYKKTEDTDTKIFSLRYSSPDKVKSAIEGAKLLSPQGNIVIDERTRSIIVKDIPSALKNIEAFIAKLDKSIRQILLETRIIEISSSFAKSIGFEWGIDWRPPDSRTIIVGSQAPPSVLGGITPIGIQLPATGTSAFTIGYINASGTFALDLRISALERSGRGKIISNPKILTMDNQKAKIIQGEAIPYGERDAEGRISTRFKDVAITVEVTPNLIDDKSLQLDLKVIKEDLVEFIDIGGVPAPRTTKLEGETKVTLKDGETVVIGGIYKKRDSITDSKVPFLGEIPILGELFKRTERDENLHEVMIFITTRILNQE